MTPEQATQLYQLSGHAYALARHIHEQKQLLAASKHLQSKNRDLYIGDNQKTVLVPEALKARAYDLLITIHQHNLDTAQAELDAMPVFVEEPSQ